MADQEDITSRIAEETRHTLRDEAAWLAHEVVEIAFPPGGEHAREQVEPSSAADRADCDPDLAGQDEPDDGKKAAYARPLEFAGYLTAGITLAVTVIKASSSDHRSIPLLVAVLVIALFLIAAPHLAALLPRWKASRAERSRRPAYDIPAAARRARIQGYADQIVTGYLRRQGQRWSVIGPVAHGKNLVLHAIKQQMADRHALVLFVEVPERPDRFRTCKQIVKGLATDSVRDGNLSARLTKAAQVAGRQVDQGKPEESVLAGLATETAAALCASRREIAVLVCNVDRAAAPETTRWVLDLLEEVAGAPDRLVVATMQQPGTPGFGLAVPVSRMTRTQMAEEVAQRLDKRMGKKLVPQTAAKIADRCGGHPLAFDVVCDLVVIDGVDTLGEFAPKTMNAKLDAAVTEGMGVLDGLVTRRFAAGRATRLALSDWLAVLDDFDGPYRTGLLERILVQEEGVTVQEAAEIVGWLVEQDSYVRPRDDSPEAGHSLLPIMREIQQEHLRAADDRRFVYLHDKVQEHYWEQVSAAPGEADRGKPGAMAQLESYQTRGEDPNWHQLVIDWIGHAQYVAIREPKRIAIACTRLFLAQYWWWDCYVRSDYCDRMLKQFQHSWGSQPWVCQLTVFRDGFVSGATLPGRPARPANVHEWDRAENALRNLWHQLLGPDFDEVPGGPAERALATYLSLMLALTNRAAGRGEAGIGWLKRARRTVDEEWNEPWITVHIAETLFELGRIEEARALAAPLERQSIDNADYDLRIVVGLIQAELARADADTAKTVDVLARTLLAAYCYHMQQECDGERRATVANQYTRQRHQEVRDRLAERLAAVPSGSARRAAEARVAAFFEPFAARRRLSGGTSRAVLPEPPTAQDLIEGQSSTYHLDLLAVARQMKDQLAEPLDTLLPAVGARQPAAAAALSG